MISKSAGRLSRRSMMGCFLLDLGGDSDAIGSERIVVILSIGTSL